MPFGVNVFAPNPVPIDAGAFRRYADAIRPEADRYGIDLGGADPVEDDDRWEDKIDLLRTDPVPIASFTFGIPPRPVIAALRKAGTLLVQTVTSAEEARIAADAGADMLAVQASAAGAHSGTLTPQRVPLAIPIAELIAQVRSAVTLPLVAAGGLATSADVAAVLRAGAQAAMVGTALLRADESGTSAAYQAALAGPSRGQTIVTRAFTGLARALRNEFTDRYSSCAPAATRPCTTSPGRSAERPPPRVTPSGSISGPGQATGTPPPSPPAAFWPGWPGRSDLGRHPGWTCAVAGLPGRHHHGAGRGHHHQGLVQHPGRGRAALRRGPADHPRLERDRAAAPADPDHGRGHLDHVSGEDRRPELNVRIGREQPSSPSARIDSSVPTSPNRASTYAPSTRFPP